MEYKGEIKSSGKKKKRIIKRERKPSRCRKLSHLASFSELLPPTCTRQALDRLKHKLMKKIVRKKKVTFFLDHYSLIYGRFSHG